MTPDALDSQVHAARQHLAALQSLSGLPPGQQAIVDQAVAQLSLTLEQLSPVEPDQGGQAIAGSERSEVAALLAGARAVLAHRSFAEAAQALFESCKQLLGAQAGYVALVTKDGTENDVVFLDSGGLACSVDPELPMPIRGLRERAFQAARAVYDNDFAGSEWQDLIPNGHVALENVLFAPLIVDGKAAGLLGLANKPGGFTADDARLAAAFGELAAVALVNDRTLDSLKSSEEHFRSVVETAGDAIITAGSDGRILFWNHAAEKIFGYTAGEVIGERLTLIMPEGLGRAHQRGLERLASGGKPRLMGQTASMTGRRKDGREFPAELSLTRWATSQGAYFTGIVRDTTERSNAETALRESQGKLRALFDLLPVGVSIVDAGRNVVESNVALERILDISRQGLAAGTYETRRYLTRNGQPMAPDDFPSVRAAREGKLVQDVEIGVQRADGSVIWTLASAVPLPFSDWRLLITTMDISDRVRAEEELRLSEQRYHQLFDSMTEGFALHEILCDASGAPCDYRFLEINPAFERLTGLKREQVLGKTVLEVLPNTEPFWIETYGHVALTGRPVRFEQYSSPLDRYFEVFSFCPAEDQFAVLFLDVTARREAEDALLQAHDELERRVRARTADLAASEERFRQLAENIHEVFWMSDASYTQILFVSPGYEELTGLACQSLYEQSGSFLQIVHHEDRQRVIEAMARQSEERHDEEYRIVRPDGAIRWVRTQTFPIHNQAGEVYRIAGVAEDVTERVEARQMLEQRVEERTRQLATLLDISHSMALTLDLEPMLDTILDRLREIVPYDGAAVFKLQKERLLPLIRRGSAPQADQPEIGPPWPGLSALVPSLTKDQGPIIVPDIGQDSPAARSFQQVVRALPGFTHDGARSWMGLPLTIRDETVGFLILYCGEPAYYTSAHAKLALAFASQAAIAIENARLTEQAQALAALEERQHLARELHDAVTQTLFSASLSAEVLPRLWERNEEEGRRCLNELHRLTRGALLEMRSLLLELRPSALTEVSLHDLLQQLVETVASRTRIPVKLEADPACRVPGEVQAALYRIAQEALNNAAKHAGATELRLTLRCRPASASPSSAAGPAEAVELWVRDNGCGFDVACPLPGGLGLTIMRERAEAVGATLEIASEPGQGSRVTVAWPGKAHE